MYKVVQMKKFISLILVAVILCAGFSACSVKDSPTVNDETEKTEIVPPVVKENHSVEKIKAADGKVSYVLDITLPEITDNLPENIAEHINLFIELIREEALRNAEANAEYAREYMIEHDTKTPWQRTITFETVYASDKYLSVEITDHFTMLGGQTTPTVYAKLFKLEDGNVLSLNDLAKVDEAELKDALVSLIIREADSKYYPDGKKLNDKQKQAIAESFDPYKFCYTPHGITLYLNKLVVDHSYSGTLCCDFTFTELRNVIEQL
jgi:hypothetical protein